MAQEFLKLTPIHAVVKVTGSTTTTETISLDDLAIEGRQTPSTPAANIQAIYWSASGTGVITVSRNSTTLFTLSSTDHWKFNGFSETAHNTSDIVVALPSSGGTVILELYKVSGWGDTQHLGNDGGAG